MPIDVLLVDGDERFLGEMEEAFRGAGVSVIATADGDEAFSLAEQTPPALVVLTVEASPGKPSGFTLCRKFRQSEQFSDVPIFILGAAVTEEVFEQHKRHKYPANEYFSKPIQASELVMSAAQYVGIGQNTESDPFDGSLSDGLDLDSLLSLDELGDLDLDGDDLELSLSSAIDAVPRVEPQGAVTVFPGQPSPEAVAAVAASEPSAQLRRTVDASPFEQAGVTDQHDVVGDPEAAVRASNELIEELASLRQQLTEAQAEAAEFRTRSSVAARELEQAKSSGDSLRERISALESQLADSASAATTSTAREMLTLRTQLNRAEGEMLSLKDEIFAREHKILELEERIEQRATEFDELRSSLSMSQQKADGLEEKVRELVATIDTRERELTERGSELDAVRVELSQASTELSSLRDELQNSRQTWSAESDSLQARLAEVVESERLARAEIEQLVVVHDERLRAAQSAFDERQAELQAEIESSTASLKQATETAAERLQELETTREQLEALRGEFASAEQNSASLAAERDTLNERIETLNERVESLTADGEQARQRLAESSVELQSSRQRLDSLQEELAQTQAARDAAADRAAAAESAGEELRQQLEAAKARNEQLEADIQESLTLADTLQEQLTARVAEAADLENQLATAASDLEASQRQVETATLESAELRTRIEAANHELDNLRRSRDELTGQLTNLQAEHEAMTALAQEAQQLHEAGAKELDELKAVNSGLNERIASLTESAERASEKRAALRNALAAYERTHEASQNVIAALQADLSAVREQHAALMDERRSNNTYLDHLSQALQSVTLLLERRPKSRGYEPLDSGAASAISALQTALDELRMARVQTGPHVAAGDDSSPGQATSTTTASVSDVVEAAVLAHADEPSESDVGMLQGVSTDEPEVDEEPAAAEELTAEQLLADGEAILAGDDALTGLDESDIVVDEFGESDDDQFDDDFPLEEALTTVGAAPSADDSRSDDPRSPEVSSVEAMFNLDDAEFVELESDLVDLDDL